MPLLAALLLFAQDAPLTIPPAPVLPPDSKPFYRAHASPDCRDWSDARSEDSPQSRARLGVYKMWVEGYITGFNMVGPDKSGRLFGSDSHGEVYSAVDGYCARNPSNMVVDAMAPIAAAFIRRRLQNSTPGNELQSPPRKAMATVTSNCGHWQEHRNNAILRLAYGNVVRGYLTAYNRWGPDPIGDAVGAADRPLIEEWLDRWCTERPSTLLVQVVHPLIAYVAAERRAGRLPLGGRRSIDTISPGSPKGD